MCLWSLMYFFFSQMFVHTSVAVACLSLDFYIVFVKADHCSLLGWTDFFFIFLRVGIVIVEMNCSLYRKTCQNLLSNVIKKLLGFGLGQIKSNKKIFLREKVKLCNTFPAKLDWVRKPIFIFQERKILGFLVFWNKSC